MVTKKPTDLKSVSLGQVKDLEGKTVVGAAGLGSDSQSSSSEADVPDGDEDLAKLDEVATKVDRDHSKPSSGKRAKDSEDAREDAAKRVDQGLPPYKPAP